MRIGFHTGYWSAGPPRGAAEAVAAADELGLDSVWTAESYGSDALTPLAWWGAQTTRVRLGTAIAQMSARTPTATAMAALTLDHLSGGRFVLGLGASGPQVVEGWYGQPFPRPLERTREYIDIVRQVFRRSAPVTFTGRHYQLPYDGGTGQGKPLTSTVHPLREDLPIFLAAQGPKNISLAAEIADGWLPAFMVPGLDAYYRERLEAGFARRSGERLPREEFEVPASVPAVIGESVEAAADQLRPHFALYIGGMGSAKDNFHRAAIARAGFEEVCEEVTRRYLAGDKAGAAAAVPTELITQLALVGPPPELRRQLAIWQQTCATTLILQTDPRMLAAIAQALANAKL